MRKEISFRFKGNRDYVHGTDLFNEIARYYNKKATYLTNIKFSIHGFIRDLSCEIVVAETTSEIDRVQTAPVHCTLDCNGISYWIIIREDSARTVERISYPFDESAIIKLCRENDRKIEISTESGYSFIETVVAMNKRMHQKLYADVSGKWVFTRLELERYPDQWDGVKLMLKHNFHNRLTKTEMTINNCERGFIYFSLV